MCLMSFCFDWQMSSRWSSLTESCAKFLQASFLLNCSFIICNVLHMNLQSKLQLPSATKTVYLAKRLLAEEVSGSASVLFIVTAVSQWLNFSRKKSLSRSGWSCCDQMQYYLFICMLPSNLVFILNFVLTRQIYWL